MNQRLLELGREVALALSGIEGVLAVVQGGSAATGRADEFSDVDIDVYSRGQIGTEARQELAAQRAVPGSARIGHRWYEGGDVWVEAASGTGVDVIYRLTANIEANLKRVLVEHQPSIGYTTALAYNVQTAVIHYDPESWFASLQTWSRQPYPEALVQAIIDYNLPLLREMPFSFRYLLETAQIRGDSFSALDTVDRFWGAYLDILFALNRAAHPGEKRLLDLALALERTPPSLAADFAALVENALTPRALGAMDSLVDGLEELLGRGQA